MTYPLIGNYGINLQESNRGRRTCPDSWCASFHALSATGARISRSPITSKSTAFWP